MRELSTVERSEFASVASGARPRARWLTANGWVRAQRSTEHTLILAGPLDELRRICHAHHDEWKCALTGPGEAPQPYQGHRGGAELILVRKGSAALSPRL